MTLNSVFSSTAGTAAAAPPPPAAAGAAAATVTLNLALKPSISSASSTTVLLPIASRISSLVSVVVAMMVSLSVLLRSSTTLRAKRLEGADHLIQQSVHGARELSHRGLDVAGQLGQQYLSRRQLGQALHLVRRHGLAVHQPDLDRRPLELPGEVRQDLGAHQGVAPREH